MNLVSRYDIACPCGETTSLLEENLRQIVDNLQELDKAAPPITFLCLGTEQSYDIPIPRN